jgi:hypothetical protein
MSNAPEDSPCDSPTSHAAARRHLDPLEPILPRSSTKAPDAPFPITPVFMACCMSSSPASAGTMSYAASRAQDHPNRLRQWLTLDCFTTPGRNWRNARSGSGHQLGQDLARWLQEACQEGAGHRPQPVDRSRRLCHPVGDRRVWHALGAVITPAGANDEVLAVLAELEQHINGTIGG